MKYPVLLLFLAISISIVGCTILEGERWPAGEKKIVLTFDDGPNGLISTRLLDVLAEYGVRATFFYVGRNVLKHKATVKRAFDDGHELGIHSFSRAMPPFWSDSQLLDDVEQSQHALREATGNSELDIKHYRPPKGMITPAVSRLLDSTELQLAYLTFYVHDAATDGSEAEHTMRKIKAAISRYQGGAVVIHESRFKQNVEKDNMIDKRWLPDAIGEFIVWAHDEGYEFVLYSDGKMSDR